MKHLYLLRHAKSSWDDNSLPDFDRPLNNRGIKTAPVVGQYIRRKKIQVDLVLSSPAKRARETSKLVIRAAGIAADLRFDERIYEATAGQLMSVVSQIGDGIGAALLVGHNPGFEDLLTRLTGEVHRLSTAALAEIALDIEEWRGIRENCGQLIQLIKPKEIEKN
jgi:phosphohistidine phosphatase